METDEAQRVLPFQLQFDKPAASQDFVVHLEMESEKVRSIPHFVVAPLAVSSSRGVACVLAARKRVLVYILDEDEDESQMQSDCIVIYSQNKYVLHALP